MTYIGSNKNKLARLGVFTYRHRRAVVLALVARAPDRARYVVEARGRLVRELRDARLGVRGLA